MTKLEDQDEIKKILFWSNFTVTLQDNFVLHDYSSIFSSINKSGKVALLEDYESTEIGLVKSFSPTSVTMKGIDGVGMWLEQDIVRPYSDLWYVIFDDEYSRILGNYAMSN